MNNRHIKILELLSIQKKIDVASLSELCKVSQVTIRKDLIELENKELLKREHGFAIVNNEDDINYRLAFNYKNKEIIAKKAVEYINNNETIMIESGSTCALLALEVAKSKSNVTIITNSVFIARYLKNYNTIKIILLGGTYQDTSETIIGSGIKESLSLYYVDKLFIGVDGVDVEYAISGSDQERCEVVKHMKKRANKVFVLTDTNKFNQKSHYKFLDFEDIDYLISEDANDERCLPYTDYNFTLK